MSPPSIMNLPSNLRIKDGVAFIGETSLLDVAKEYGTPLYVYDWEHLEIILIILRMLLEKRPILDMQQKLLSVKR